MFDVFGLQVASDSASSTSTYTLPSPRGPSKKAVKLVNKGIQAGQSSKRGGSEWKVFAKVMWYIS